ncbi:MATE family efflux transporter [Floccifex sp.]|uniref:MATE family efflux transporter n=1 Tax=Floccifex sp. TaxID=2815810 RepID=UPI002A75E2C9|nr:MATE family efflux transporter [Floccifex sp.]MDD7281115.1 MATE family efflux transporter [Erysipelotrichaceae bacterium]MDY2957780.1 MATE family efflux transporter [Floccifex sp.]
MKKEVDLRNDKVSTLLLTLAIPAILSQLVNALYNMVDRMYIGHIENVGSLALTGVGVCFPLIMIVSAFASLVGMGGAPRASIFMGKQDNKSAEKIMGNCFVSLVFISLLLTGVLLLFNEPLLRLFQASDNTLPYASSYLKIYALGTIFVQMTLGMNAFISTQGFSKISMMTVCIGAISNIILDPILIFGFNLGVSGAALATVLSQAISAIWVIRFLFGDKTILKLRKENFKIDFSLLLPSLALGISPFIMQSTESLLTLCFNMQLSRFGGDLALGAMTILSSIMQFCMMPLQGITQGGQPIISYNYGAQNGSRIKEAFKLQTLSCVAYSTLIWGMVQLFPSLFIQIFTNDAALLEISTWAIRIYMATVLLMGIQISCQQTFIAFGNAKISIFLAIFRKIIVLIPLIFILPCILENKVFAVFLAEPIADFIAVSMTATLFYFNFKKIMKSIS